MVARDAGVIHQNVEALPLLEYLLHDAASILLTADVTPQYQALHAKRANFLGNTLGVSGVSSVIDCDVGAAVGQFQRDRPANAAKRP
jgi:hypothetical protein